MKIFWLTQNFTEIPKSSYWLHPSEEKIANRFRFPKKRNDWVLGRWTAKKAVTLYSKTSHPDISLSQLEIRAAASGAPEVFFKEKPFPVQISLSHSQGTGFCIISRSDFKIGCDLEMIESRSDAFVNDYFTVKEQTIIAGSNPKDRAQRINLIWSAKESALKAMRTGLRMDTRSVEVEPSISTGHFNWNKLSVCFLDQKKLFHGFWLSSQKYIYTIVCEEKEFQLAELHHLEP